jgi:hypothetical protein
MEPHSTLFECSLRGQHDETTQYTNEYDFQVTKKAFGLTFLCLCTVRVSSGLSIMQATDEKYSTKL